MGTPESCYQTRAQEFRFIYLFVKDNYATLAVEKSVLKN